MSPQHIKRPAAVLRAIHDAFPEGEVVVIPADVWTHVAALLTPAQRQAMARKFGPVTVAYLDRNDLQGV